MQLKKLYIELFKEEPKRRDTLPLSGSSRVYSRLRPEPGKTLPGTGLARDPDSVIGVHNSDVRENEAFFYLNRHFRERGLSVPGIFAISADRQYYLQQDLGNIHAWDILHERAAVPGWDREKVISESMRTLARFQVLGHEGLDYTKCYPRPCFDSRSILWDLNQFKYFFLKLAEVPFDEDKLQEEMDDWAEKMERVPLQFFMYRDFQSRNLLLHDDQLYGIDFQGGRKGPVHYDLASFLFSGSAGLDARERERGKRAYIEALTTSLNQVVRERPDWLKQHASESGLNGQALDKRGLALALQNFEQDFAQMVLLRLLQAMGTYGFRGWFQAKEQFLRSIPHALDRLGEWLAEYGDALPYPQLVQCLQALLQAEPLKELTSHLSTWVPGSAEGAGRLKVEVGSFSYRNGLPRDKSGHGGGFIFDCRILPNPGREALYADLTGKDQLVKEYLQTNPKVAQFAAEVESICVQAVESYLSRGFTQLSIQFGCTGGQHRSVFMAEKIAHFLARHFPVTVQLSHRERGWEPVTLEGPGQTKHAPK